MQIMYLQKRNAAIVGQSCSAPAGVMQMRIFLMAA